MRYIWSCPLFPVIVAYMKVRDPYLPKTVTSTGVSGDNPNYINYH